MPTDRERMWPHRRRIRQPRSGVGSVGEAPGVGQRPAGHPYVPGALLASVGVDSPPLSLGLGPRALARGTAMCLVNPSPRLTCGGTTARAGRRYKRHALHEGLRLKHCRGTSYRHFHVPLHASRRYATFSWRSRAAVASCAIGESRATWCPPRRARCLPRTQPIGHHTCQARLTRSRLNTAPATRIVRAGAPARSSNRRCWGMS